MFPLVEVKTTPRILAEEILSMPGTRGGRVLLGRRETTDSRLFR